MAKDILDKEVYWFNLLEQVKAIKKAQSTEFPTEQQWDDLIQRVEALETAGQ